LALALSPQGSGQAPPTEDEVRTLLEEAFPGTEATIVEIGNEEPRVVIPESFDTPQFVVRAVLSGVGDVFEVNAFVSFQRSLRLRYVEHQGLMMSAEELLQLIQRDRQRRAIEQMRDLATANGVMRVATGRYATYLLELQELDYMPEVPVTDPWGNAWLYDSPSSRDYTLVSLGADGATGPAAPARWLL